MNAAPTARPTPFPKAVSFFRRHPVLLLLCFSPGIVEYLSGSSSFEGIVRAPFLFLLFLGFNLGLYGPGVLLVREAIVRWKKGWASLICLGAAYGLLEEGTALSTLFDPTASVVGGLGYYGHYLGVSWIWVIGVLEIHAVVSIGIPILLLGLALPETRGRPLLTGRQPGIALGIFAFDIVLLAYVSHYYPVGFFLQLFAVLVAGGLAYLAYRLPPGILDPTSEHPCVGRGASLLLGLAFYPILLLVPAIGGTVHAPAPLTGVVDVALSGGLFFVVRRVIGRSHNEPELILLILGALIPILAFGFIAQIFLPIVLVGDLLFALFFYSLWRRYATARGGPPTVVPAGAT